MPTHLTNAALPLVPATIDDLERLTRIFYEVTASTAPVLSVIHPRGATEAIIASDIAAYKRAFHRPEVFYRKIVAKGDHRDDEIVAIVRWYLWPEGRNDAAWIQPYKFTADPALPPDDINLAAADAYYSQVDAMKKRHVQNMPHLYISLLATRPRHQGHGYGKRLVEEATAMAKQRGLDNVFLLSVSGSRSFYERCGFKVIDTLSLNLAALSGAQGDKPDQWVDTYMMHATLS
ncbi:uncharacterized protein SPSK_07919 [Sporothrix schenckii 1099-18]|uniref:N-acetyltransferase domain-containing protein n=2 Tax=Sporothrix schenckii TaxID=29908 RepID=U7Q335_SPOS1|nr:uncharacterized protein SPSK_07919 [Sporothrix schenckii 1099-18]ERT01390.1 hypothetical protein HMPREF1624_02636 [Sporothrix schenckii ATCC 58251]KJR88578.1 hypothetical protein SPSK_07919 [Sporothrix schenckii 1099-18]